ncbi:hypothetical protein LAUMK15_02599 [Mycobacterium persicum]|nr:hypothetical protein LAUMK15_02599 [Mycobacterium persicum]
MAEQSGGGAAIAALTAVSAVDSGSAGSAMTAIAGDQAACSARAAGSSVTPRPSGPAVSSVAEQSGIAAATSRLARGTRRPVAPVAPQPPAVPAGLAWRGSVDAVANQYAPREGFRGRVHHVQEGLRDICSFGVRVGGRSGSHGLHKLVVKCLRLSADYLICLTVRGKHRCDRRRHLIGARGQHCRYRWCGRRVGLANG